MYVLKKFLICLIPSLVVLGLADVFNSKVVNCDNLESKNFVQIINDIKIYNHSDSDSNKKLLACTPNDFNSIDLQKVYITPTGKRYHKRKCGLGDYFSILLKDAKSKGYSPCRKCFK